jgi:hypothetical protein
MTYQIIQPPFTLEFTKMSKDQLRAYDEWFRTQIPLRVRELTDAVRETAEFSGWDADFTPESLGRLGEWLTNEIETRARTETEIRELARDNPYPIEIPEQTLTNRSYSLAVDTGMYLSEVLLRNHRSLRWHQVLHDKRSANYGQPLLLGAGPVPLNPVRVALAFAFGLVRGSASAEELRELFNIWTDMLIHGKPPSRGPKPRSAKS